MKQAVSVGWGGNLHLLSSPLGPRTVAQTLVNSPGEGAGIRNNIINEWEATGAPGGSDDYHASLFGGPMTTLPGSWFNHKPGAFYYGQFYYSQNQASVLTSRMYLLRFDGSGVFAQASAGSVFANKSHSGRGVDFLSPSGSNLDIHSHGLCCLPHNGNIFWVGAVKIMDFNPDASNYKVLEDWNIGASPGLTSAGADGGFGLNRRRAYVSFSITKTARSNKEQRNFGKLFIGHNRTIPSGLAPTYESLNGNDAISWGDDIIYTNNVDIVLFPGGSGTGRFIETSNSETSKSLEAHPSGGFNQQTGATIGPTQLFILTGSGVLKKINLADEPEYDKNGVPFGNELFENPQSPASGRPFGVKSLIDLGQFVSDFAGPKVRTLGSRARILSVTAEPDRSCFLKTFNRQLHAFFISASSGYYHFVCEGDPRRASNWTDRTATVPDAIKLFDGCVFGFRDDDFGTLNIMHTAWSNVGWAGVAGGNRGNGGWAVYSLAPDLSWTKYYFGAASTAPVGLIPYNPQTIFAEIPSGIRTGPAPSNPEVIASTDYILMDYSLYTGRAPGVIADVDIEYTTDDGVTWKNATQFKDYNSGSGLGEGKIGLEASPFGTEHEFFWAHVKDLGFNFNKAARLRVSPRFQRL